MRLNIWSAEVASIPLDTGELRYAEIPTLQEAGKAQAVDTETEHLGSHKAGSMVDIVGSRHTIELRPRVPATS
jgi:hypothetical protein